MLNFSNKMSTLMGAPPNDWRELERDQMKKIQNCYKVAYSGVHDVRIHKASVESEEMMNGSNRAAEDEETGKKILQAKDGEMFLPKNSPLRSKGGEMKRPENAVFKDYDTFLNSCNMDYWQHYFDKNTGDQKLVESARAVVSNICVVQSKNQLRVKKGAVPFRKTREHITPLALCLHEIKDWCVTSLRTADPNDEQSFKEIRNRMVYFEGLAQKEVWGNTALLFGQGISMTGHDKLFRMLNTGRNLLEEAENYCYRKYCGRSSREDLAKLTAHIQKLINREVRVISGRFELEAKLEDPKTAKINPALLLQRIEDMQTVDFKNFANVLLYKLFQNAFVKACFNSHFETTEVKEIIKELGQWSDGNLFCKKAADEPIYIMEKSKHGSMMPQIYKPTVAELKMRIRSVDTRTKVPDTIKEAMKKLMKAFEDEEVVAKAIKAAMKTLAAIQELIPTLYAVHRLYELAGEGGNFTIYDNMRENVIKLMEDILARVKTLRKASHALSKIISKKCSAKEKEIKEKQMKTGKTKYKPNWVMNHRYISTTMENKAVSAHKQTVQSVRDIMKKAKDYSLTSDELSDKVAETKNMINSLIGTSGNNFDIEEVEEIPARAPPNTFKKPKEEYQEAKEYESDEESDYGFGQNNQFGQQKVQNYYAESDSESE